MCLQTRLKLKISLRPANHTYGHASLGYFDTAIPQTTRDGAKDAPLLPALVRNTNHAQKSVLVLQHKQVNCKLLRGESNNWQELQKAAECSGHAEMRLGKKRVTLEQDGRECHGHLLKADDFVMTSSSVMQTKN